MGLGAGGGIGEIKLRNGISPGRSKFGVSCNLSSHSSANAVFTTSGGYLSRVLANRCRNSVPRASSRVVISNRFVSGGGLS